MYELNQKQALSKWKKYQDACEALFAEQYLKAIELLEEYIAENNPKSTEDEMDKPALHLVNLCKLKL